MEGAEPAAARAARGLGRVGGVRGREQGVADPGRPRQRGRLPHRPRRRLRRDVVPLLRPDHARVVDLLGRQPPAGAARPARGRLVHRRHRRLRGRRHLQGQADPRPLHLVAGDDRRARAGSRPSRTTAARPGRRTGSTTSRASEETHERRPSRLPASDEGDRARRRRSSSAGARSSGTTSRPPTSPCRGRSGRWRAGACAALSTPARSTSTTTSAS